MSYDQFEPAEWPHGVKHDGLRGLLLGERLGYGQNRIVYECGFDPSLVVKVELGTTHRQNFAEWQLWTVVSEAATDSEGDARRRFKELQRWLCPVVRLSEYGGFLVMRRTQPIPEAKLPKRMPAPLFDFKPANFGLLDGRVVCHDYGIVAGVLLNNCLCGKGPSLAMKLVHWNL